MKKVAAVLAVVCMCSSAFGGTIAFTPMDVTIDPAVDPLTFTLDMSVGGTTVGMMDSVDVFVGSDDLAITDFEWAPFTRFFDSSEANTDYYQSGWKFGYFGTAADSTDFLLGTLTVDATGLAPGAYQVMVDAGRDGNRSGITGGGVTDLVEMSIASVTIIPEPATISLLALGALALIRRRKSA